MNDEITHIGMVGAGKLLAFSKQGHIVHETKEGGLAILLASTFKLLSTEGKTPKLAEKVMVSIAGLKFEITQDGEAFNARRVRS